LILLVSGLSGDWAAEYLRLNAPVGFLVTPQTGDSRSRVFAVTNIWAADNDCFKGLDRPAYERMLAAWQGAKPGPLWFNAPDVVADARTTLERFEEWEPILHRMGFPVALTLQDGQENLPVPWNRLEAVFVGGSTRWKLSMDAARLCQEAKRRGKWVHAGRVNSLRRMELMARAGVDSIDGSGFSRWKKLIAPGVRWIRQAEWLAQNQPELFSFHLRSITV